MNDSIEIQCFDEDRYRETITIVLFNIQANYITDHIDLITCDLRDNFFTLNIPESKHTIMMKLCILSLANTGR